MNESGPVGLCRLNGDDARAALDPDAAPYATRPKKARQGQ